MERTTVHSDIARIFKLAITKLKKNQHHLKVTIFKTYEKDEVKDFQKAYIE